jgi:Trm5-related predicted tRNA methylase
MLSHFVVQHQKYYEHILRPQIDEIIIITNIQSEEKLLIKIDDEEISLNESDIIFLSEIKSDRIIFLNQSEKQIFQIYTCKASKPKSLL